MALYPRAVKKLIPPGKTDPRVDVMVGTIAHVAVSMADSLHDYFNGPSGGVESHFYIRLSGVVEQYRDTAYEADAQGAGNSWLSDGKRYGFISYETEGMGSGTWTAAQLAAIKDLILWGRSAHYYPMVKARGYHGPGHGYHAQFDQWNPSNHSCPGEDRIRQFNSVIVPWLAAPQEDDMTPAELLATPLGTNPADHSPSTVREALDISKNYSFLGWQAVRALGAQVAALSGAVEALAKDGDVEAVKAAVAEALDKYTLTLTKDA